MEKKCSKCGEVKNIYSFVPDKRNTDKHGAICRQCNNEYSANYSKKHKQSIAERMKEYNQGRRERTAEISRKYRQSEKGKISLKNAYTKLKTIFTDKYKAHSAVGHAVQAGRMPNIKKLTCSVCNNKQAEQYHHHKGYDKKNWLEVIPVCSVCHKILDYKNGG